MEIETFKIQIEPLRQPMLHLARKLTGEADDAEDVVQDVLLKLWNRREELEQCHNLRAFVFTMVRNASIDFLRTRHTDTTSLLDALNATDEQSPDRYLEAKDEMRLMHAIIHSLPPLQQTILRMKDIEEYETEEIAQITGCSPEAIRSNLSRARKRVRETYLNITQERRNKI
ncbi:RNA polymerase subunit sigma-70 [Mediterranea sp. An20]|jgi:RNA polymerase sigma-70 factor (ECF subfamily)|uniref:RNA polymerase sigma factor n=1 Tax=Mediterranea sp. An20 TaxID=1965586 RepID=UPI000B36C4AA|nr:RNA polymerase sigma factor [Mediterranea sp. An20]OUP09946.1 RNA polymerase subunit sigma-70 [Mediterranea sp. An20]